MSAAAVLDVARREIGTAENPPKSNRTKYGADYGWNGVAWCAIWAWWVLTRAGAAPLIPKTASTVTMRDWYRARGQWHTSQPVPGDLVFFKFEGNNNPVNHVGIVEAVEPGGTLITIEGNTAGTNAGDQRNGGGVYRKRRTGANIVGFARPAYATTTAVARGDWFDMATKDELRALLREELGRTVWETTGALPNRRGPNGEQAGKYADTLFGMALTTEGATYRVEQLLRQIAARVGAATPGGPVALTDADRKAIAAEVANLLAARLTA